MTARCNGEMPEHWINWRDKGDNSSFEWFQECEVFGRLDRYVRSLIDGGIEGIIEEK